jgi:8-hydroxy-5-deazaflavin:NADPH oxidoreductase
MAERGLTFTCSDQTLTLMNIKKVGVLGSGQVGQVLSDGFLKHGYEVMRGSRDPSKLAGWRVAAGSNAATGTFAEAARFGDIVALCVKGSAAEEAVGLCGDGLNGKVVLDATNPLSDTPPVNGVLVFLTGPNESLMERLQKRAPAAKFVKAFSSAGSSLFVDPQLPAKPTMFICGNDAVAKDVTRTILDQFGWETEDCGGVEGARAIEPLCILWCIPGFLRNDWVHAFKMLRP